MRHYITLFDSNYLVKGLLMLRSLRRVSRDPYEVTVIALDDRVASLKSANAIFVPYATLEAEVATLQEMQQTRTHREWCWSLASAALRWRLAQVEPGDIVTYLDSDLGFFGDPEECFGELGDRSIGIVPHRFAAEYESYIDTSGEFNVSWVSLRNDEVGRQCAEAWTQQVLANCSESECGDQRYLDTWPTEYGDHLCIFGSPGIGVAPWNVFGYKVGAGARDATVDAWPAKYGDCLRVFKSPGLGVGPENVSNYKVEAGPAGVTVNGHSVIFYHYHELVDTLGKAPPITTPETVGGVRYLDGFRLTLGYPLRAVDIDTFYRGYCQDYRALEDTFLDAILLNPEASP
jgi:hypothetical protein